MRRAALLLLLLWPGPAGAAGDLASALRAGDWPAAETLAARAVDPVAARLVRYLRLLTPGAAKAGEIAAFLDAEANWPQRALLERRYADALASERDDQAALALCTRRKPATAPALLRCADAEARAGQPGEGEARTAWLVGIIDPAAEAAFMRRWGSALQPDDQRRRFDRLAWTGEPSPGGTLARQAVRLDPAGRALAETRLALRRDDPAAPALFAALTAAAQADPGLVLDLLRWLRRANRDGPAAQLWAERGGPAEQAAPAERQALFWDERNLLARRLLRAQQDPLAYAVASLPAASAEARVDQAFLCGWIALRRLGRPELAAAQFRALGAGSSAAITQARAHYWLGRALAAAGDADGSETALRQAALWPTTYYGQLAALALGEGVAGLNRRVRAVADPAWTEADALDIAASETARAAALLVAWGEPRRAKAFLQLLEDASPVPAARSLLAHFASELGLPDEAVAAARRAGRDGVALPLVGWPEAADPPPAVERAVALGLIRQESSFDAVAGSPAGAQGLMQLMPATAAQVAHQLGDKPGPLTDPAVNLRLGTAYLAGLLGRFGALPPALAAYNAGPGRAQEWIAAFGDPAAGTVDPIDWVELIPFSETRNYVQRVVENVVIYRARAGADLPHPVLQWGSSGS